MGSQCKLTIVYKLYPHSSLYINSAPHSSLCPPGGQNKTSDGVRTADSYQRGKVSITLELAMIYVLCRCSACIYVRILVQMKLMLCLQWITYLMIGS